jgi:hypothetical protein
VYENLGECCTALLHQEVAQKQAGEVCFDVLYGTDAGSIHAVWPSWQLRFVDMMEDGFLYNEDDVQDRVKWISIRTEGEVEGRACQEFIVEPAIYISRSRTPR